MDPNLSKPADETNGNADLNTLAAAGANDVAKTDPLAGNAEQSEAGDTKHGDDDSTT